MRFLFAAILTMSCVVSLRGDDTIDYARQIYPILEAHCVGCHTEDDAEGGLVMESHSALMRGGESGSAVTSGAASSSRLMLMVKGLMDPVMPPEGEEPLSEEQISLLSDWIDQGAAGPDGEMPFKRELRTPKINRRQDVKLPITAYAISPDGDHHAVATFGKVEIHDADGAVVQTFGDELNKVNAIEFSRDGSRLLVASGVTGAYGNAIIFSVESGETLAELVGHRDVLYAAKFSPDETQVATAGYDREIVIWDAETGEPIRKLAGHNGAIFDLAYSPDGEVLVSACADETVKVWNVDTGKRLDTLSQPEGEVFAVDITLDGKFILAGSEDNRLRVWQLRSKTEPKINPIVATRFVDETPLVNFELTPDGKALVVLSEGGNLKLIRTDNWQQAASLKPLGENGSDLSVSPDGAELAVSLMNGEVVTRVLPGIQPTAELSSETLDRVYLDLGDLTQVEETKARETAAKNPTLAAAVPSGNGAIPVARGVEIQGSIGATGEKDAFQWQARKGEVWAIDADAVSGSKLDPTVAIFDSKGEPVLRVRLQAVRDSYFTFRGKDSKQISDFRLFNWQEMHLNDYLYAAGEVTRLWMYPRGPDSGYNVYPNEGNRWTYFGTSHTTHALGEPAYVVQPLKSGETPVANGLPIFDLYYENDDDPQRVAGKNSRLLFTAPADGGFSVRISDTRGDGGEGFGYRLAIRPATPGFKPSVAKPKADLRRGAGREFVVRVDRMDGFDGPVTFDVANLPPGVVSNAPLTIEPGQRFAVGTLWIAESAEAWPDKVKPEVIARATVGGRVVERRVGDLGELTLGERPNVIPSIQPVDTTVAEDENWTLQVRRGETVAARVVVRRKEGFKNEVSFGKENSGRNTTHGVYVDNIGLNGLLVRQNEDEREFFLTADPIAQPGKRSFFLSGEVDGKVTTHPITVEVLP